MGLGEPSVNGDVTWIHRTKPSLLWNQPGGDYVSTASASRIVGSGGGPYVWASTPALVADAQQWLATPASNHGWIVIGFEGGSTSAKAFAAREETEVAARPTLTVQYTVPAVAEQDVPLPAWAIAVLALGLILAIGRRNAT